jgi:hypothetical protein
MDNNLNAWQKLQLEKYKNKSDHEYIFEDNESFTILFDKDMKILNFKIFKEDIKNRQDLITEFIKSFYLNSIDLFFNLLIFKFFTNINQLLKVRR